MLAFEQTASQDDLNEAFIIGPEATPGVLG